jgi:hypothetical protein
VSALDAGYVLQAVAGLRALDATQTLACDVTGDGTLSALDASRILQRAVGMLARFPVAEVCESDFIFLPIPAAPIAGRTVPFRAGGAACTPGAIELEPVTEDVGGLDFIAAAFGDCTGNWQPAQ